MPPEEKPVRGPFRLLYVCTGNICRSPMAQSIATWRLADVLGPQAASFDVFSAGTAAVIGAGMEPAAGRALTGQGIRALPVRARAVDTGLVAGADLILTATREHRAAVARLLPRAVQRSFTMADFDRLSRAVEPAELSGGDPVDRARQLVERAGRLRGTLPPAAPADTDLPDPYGMPDKHFDRCAVRLIELSAYWPRLLAGPESA